MPYEAQARVLVQAKVGYSARRTTDARDAANAGREFRKSRARSELTRLILRQEVRWYRGQRAHPKVEPEDREFPNRVFELRDFEYLDVSKSTIGARAYDRIEIELDALDLLKRTDECRERRGDKEQFDWGRIERMARVLIERDGFPAKSVRLEERLLRLYARCDPDRREPTLSTLQERVSRLRAEYTRR